MGTAIGTPWRRTCIAPCSADEGVKIVGGVET
jgi:hypothetical protein